MVLSDGCGRRGHHPAAKAWRASLLESAGRRPAAAAAAAAGPFNWTRLYTAIDSPAIPFRNQGSSPGARGSTAFVRADGTPAFDAADVLRLFRDKRVTVIGDSISWHLHEMLVLSVQCLGYEQIVTKSSRMLYCNGTYDDTAADVRRKWMNKTVYDEAKRVGGRAACVSDCLHNHFHIGPPFNVSLGYYEVYRMPIDREKSEKYTLWPQLLEFILDRSDIVMVNLGIHYQRQNALLRMEVRLAEHIALLAARMAAFNRVPGKLAFFRETLPQHFFTEDGSGGFEGFWPKKWPVEVTNTCHPAPNLHLQWWRNSIIHEEAEAAGVLVQPVFWEMDMWDHHIVTLFRQNTCRDCTHFAFVPSFWLPVLDTMYRTAALGLCSKRMLPLRLCTYVKAQLAASVNASSQDYHRRR
eukprot:SM000009S23652  [mRNA]  locus=s9:1282698:1285283:- [translate_table: standard]